MAAILFSFDERQTDMNNAGTHLKEHTELLQTDMRDAKKHLKEHSELYWIVGFGIRRDQFTYPIDGYMHVKGRNVQYKVKIKDIKSFSREHYADKDAELFMPQKWIDWWLRNELKEEEKKYKPKNTKRDPSAFKEVSAIIGVKPHLILFVDDNAQNIKRAEKAGLRTIHFTGVDVLKARLEAFLGKNSSGQLSAISYRRKA